MFIFVSVNNRDKEMNANELMVISYLMNDIGHTGVNFETLKEKGSDYVAILHFKGLYAEPPQFWSLKWVQFDKHRICVSISKTDFDLYYRPEIHYNVG